MRDTFSAVVGLSNIGNSVRRRVDGPRNLFDASDLPVNDSKEPI
ncbi:hypothetical protein I552_2149 [Mycobacterium xenopi 3993]|nr:hypothetical protein I552_2149 [Mycobacterium xenopi 3993]